MKKLLELYRKHEEIVNYLIVGVCTTIVSLLSYLISTRTFLDVENPVQLQIANIIKWVSGVVFGYFTNRRFVFKSKNKNMLGEFLSFSGSRVATLFLDMGIIGLMVSIMGIWDIIATGVSMVLVTIANYILSKLIVFRKKKSKPESN